jgi:hypothetical protein
LFASAIGDEGVNAGFYFIIYFFLATQFVFLYLDCKNEEVGQKTKVVGQRNPKLQEWEDQEVIPLWRSGVGSA